MFFEGSEKKIEVIFSQQIAPLRSQPESFWTEIVEASKAQILSQVSNDSMTAYLLSESSLFVYDHYLVMITCGTTELVNAVEKLMTRFQPENIQAFFYERKNELLPREQSSDFFSDVEKLKTWFDGKAMRFGREDEHHLHMFATNQSYLPDKDDHTMEVLMHGIAPEVMELFQRSDLSKQELRDQSGISQIVSGTIDDYLFKPYGYSLNAIKEDRYFTIHITPESQGSYVSFETNAYSKDEQLEVAKRVITTFRPKSFDLVLFNTEKADSPNFADYQMSRQYYDQLATGYKTQYYSFHLPDSIEQPPTYF